MALTKKLLAWIRLIRIGNSLAIGFASLVGYKVGGGNLFSIEALLLFISAMLIGAGSNAINDYFDRDVDAINKPWRPIPSGIISARTAYIASIAMLCIGTSLALAISVYNALIAGLASILAYAYSWRLKKVLLIGNFSIAILSGLTIVYGGISAPNPYTSLVPALYAFLINLGREFLKGIEDVEGDRKYGISTLATRFSTRVAYISSIAVLSILIAISPLPYLLLNYTLLYLAIAIIGVDATIIYALYIARSLNPSKAWKATRIMKISMFSGLVAFFVG